MQKILSTILLSMEVRDEQIYKKNCRYIYDIRYDIRLRTA